VSAAERARAAYALAEIAEDPRDKAAFRAAAHAWEQIARPGVTFSLDPLRRDLVQLKRDAAAATGPFQAPMPERNPVEIEVDEEAEVRTIGRTHKVGIAF
jgi:hypothetical protein